MRIGEGRAVPAGHADKGTRLWTSQTRLASNLLHHRGERGGVDNTAARWGKIPKMPFSNMRQFGAARYDPPSTVGVRNTAIASAAQPMIIATPPIGTKVAPRALMSEKISTYSMPEKATMPNVNEQPATFR